MSMVQLVPMWRLTDRIVRSGLVMAWRLATSPTRTSPFLAKATTEGVVFDPSALGITTGSPPSRTDTTELVVPRSIPTALGMTNLLRERGSDFGECTGRTSASVGPDAHTVSAITGPAAQPGYLLDCWPA